MPTELQATWGKRLREIRTERGLTGGDLGKAAGVTRQHIQRIETGQSAVSDTVKIRIAEALGVEVTDIFDYTQIGE